MMAALLGAQSVLALDYDQVAVKVASENVVHNGLEKVVTVQQNDLLSGIAGKAISLWRTLLPILFCASFPRCRCA